jgi:hypothetical protein
METEKPTIPRTTQKTDERESNPISRPRGRDSTILLRIPPTPTTIIRRHEIAEIPLINMLQILLFLIRSERIAPKMSKMQGTITTARPP